ncbi:hypothetical protein KFL_001350140 [Klebsormidium nitens]|uniref:R3H domain-containing protein n=1 Tax=Klebsormidium nitens TaxID=105231 RepID=A0A1Y1I0X4_KLENI|nr:hypothetical protein KFL_001350140 [Klebsormidium nitens]|eukprot:GAQ83089.1 hypothetical protein KFL_001350140 [Klebsormidium nitens]
MAAVVAKDEEHAWEEMSELAHLVQHNAAVRLQLLEVEDMLVAWMDLPPESPVLHLPPASPYFRMLVHRLVEAFGVTHVSFGEGEDRHIVLQRNEDSEVPPLLLLDVLSVADGPSLPSAAPQILRRLSGRNIWLSGEVTPDNALVFNCLEQSALNRSFFQHGTLGMTESQQRDGLTTSDLLADPADGTPPPKTPPDPLPTLSERQQAYEEARARIFARDYSDGIGGPSEDYERTTERERRVPVVAQRLIGRALGVATGGTRGGENLRTGQNGARNDENGQLGVTSSRNDSQTEGNFRKGEKTGGSDCIEKGPQTGVTRDGENEGRGGARVLKAVPGQASLGEMVERRGGAENAVRLSDARRGVEKGGTDCEGKERKDCDDGLQQRGLESAHEETVTRGDGKMVLSKESGGKTLEAERKSYRGGGRKRATKARDGSQSGKPSSPNEVGRGEVSNGQIEEAKNGETGDSPVRNAVQNFDEDGASAKTPSHTGLPEPTTSLAVDSVQRRAGKSPGQGAGARMFRMALPRGQVGQRVRTERSVRTGELPKDETSAGERPCRESFRASIQKDVGDVENGRDVSNVCPSKREESSTRNSDAGESQEFECRDTHASRLERDEAAEKVESTVKRKGLPLVAGKMLSHALGLTQRGWGQVGRP